MNKWRIIETDSENLTGVAPVCPQQADPSGQHDREDDESVVYDCCPGPHLECYSTQGAREIVELLSRWEVAVCE